MKKIIILILIALSICQAKVVEDLKKIGKTKCYVRVNPTKGLIENGPCIVTSIEFYDTDGMWIGSYNEKLKPYYSYKDVSFSSISYIEDTKFIIATFDKSDDENKRVISNEPADVIYQPYGSPYPDGEKLPSHCWGNPEASYWCSWRNGTPSL